METIHRDGFKVIGLKVTTTNENGKSAEDIGQLWQKFMSEGMSGKIPNLINSEILSIYCDYEGDYTKPYDTILGCKVSSLDVIPEGMVGQEFSGGDYAKFTAKGNLTKGVVYNAWIEIWNTDLNRTYLADYEIYGENAQNPEDAVVDIFVGIH